ncbi:unnamed protein product, partial [Cyprideis torosa]
MPEILGMSDRILVMHEGRVCGEFKVEEADQEKLMTCATAINAIIAVGMTLVILTAGIDLSVGSVLALCGAVGASLVARELPVSLAIGAALGLGALLGVANGVIIAKGKVQAFIATLVGMTMYRAVWYLLNHTRLGRYIYALGGNEAAARLSAINVDRVKIAVYAIAGFLSALAGLIVTSRLSSAQPTAGMSYELDAIAAVVLGGTSLMGGKGSVVGTLV